MTGPDPGQAQDAEASLLGAAMSGYDDLHELLAVVRPTDFYQPFHGDVWTAIGTLTRSGTRPDPVTVRAELDRAGVRYDPLRLVDLQAQAHFAGSAPSYATEVIKASGYRALMAAAVGIRQVATTPGDLAPAQARAQALVEEATRARGATRAHTLGDVYAEVVGHAENPVSDLLTTGWPDLDSIIGGLAPGRLVTVGARPGIGKSLLSTNIALHFGKHHHRPTLIASMEMDKREAGQRLLAADAGVGLTALMQGTLNEAEWSRVAASTAKVHDLPIVVDDQPTQTVAHIIQAARKVRRVHGDLAAVFVDYIQLVEPSRRSDNRAADVADISRGLKLLARETGACVVALAQVNREGTKHRDGRPRMTDLRESGAIEADSDQVILLHQQDEQSAELEVIVAKNRHGAKGKATLMMQGHFGRLVSAQWSPTRNL